MANKSFYAAGVDAGSARTRCAICLCKDGNLKLLGFGEAPSHGWKKGRIADQNAVSLSILQAVREAEQSAGISIESAVFGLGGPSVAGANSRGFYDVGFPRQIDQADVNRAVERAFRIQLQEDQMVLHFFPQNFALDGNPGHRNPRGAIGAHLEAYVHLISASSQEHHGLIGAANQAHLSVEETVFEPVAAAYAALLPEERREGIAIIDIGAQSTDLVVYYGEALCFSASLPICGDHFSRDVARGLFVTLEEAECLKEQHGCAVLGLTSDNSLIEVPSAPGRPVRETYRRELNTILEARADELFTYVENELQRVAVDQSLMAVVLTGGGAQLQGMCDMAERKLRCQARNGLAVGVEDWPGYLDTPAWTTVAGLAMYSARLKLRSDIEQKKTGFLSGILR